MVLVQRVGAVHTGFKNVLKIRVVSIHEKYIKLFCNEKKSRQNGDYIKNCHYINKRDDNHLCSCLQL